MDDMWSQQDETTCHTARGFDFGMERDLCGNHIFNFFDIFENLEKHRASENANMSFENKKFI